MISTDGLLIRGLPRPMTHLAEDAVHDVLSLLSILPREVPGQLKAYLRPASPTGYAICCAKTRPGPRAGERHPGAGGSKNRAADYLHEELRLLSAALAELPDEQRK
jgi:hypothetical protein